MPVAAGSVTQVAELGWRDRPASGVGFREDLCCGRLDVWLGVPHAGPAPGPGTAGDCDP